MKTILIKCPNCQQERLVRLNNYKHKGFTGVCIKCHVGRPIGETSEVRDNGYVYLGCKNHPRSKKGYVKRAVLVMEGMLKRLLTTSEHIHHLNGKRDDDRLKNLIIITNSEHCRLHAIERWGTLKRLGVKGRMCRNVQAGG